MPIRVPIDPPEGGVKTRSYILPEMIRAVSLERFHSRRGSVSRERMEQVEENLLFLLGM